MLAVVVHLLIKFMIYNGTEGIATSNSDKESAFNVFEFFELLTLGYCIETTSVA